MCACTNCYVCIDVCTYVCAYVRMYIHMCMHVRTYVRTLVEQLHSRTHPCVLVLQCTNTWLHTYVCTYCTYVCTCHPECTCLCIQLTMKSVICLLFCFPCVPYSLQLHCPSMYIRMSPSSSCVEAICAAGSWKVHWTQVKAICRSLFRQQCECEQSECTYILHTYVCTW